MILDKINTPEDLRQLPEDSLIQLCADIRQKLLKIARKILDI